MEDNTQVLEDVSNSGADRAAEPARPTGPENPSKPEARKSPLGLIVFLLALAAAATGAGLWWIHSDTYESTDDAQVDAHLSTISSRVAGTVTPVYVEENQ